MAETKNSNIYEWEELFVRCFKPLCAFVYSYVPDLETVKDIVQDTFVSLWARRHEYSPTPTLLYTAAKNKTLDHLKSHPQSKTQRGLPVEAFIAQIEESPDEEFDTREVIDRVWAIVETLPPQCRKIFTMSRREGMKNREIAAELDISVKAVEKQIAKAQTSIRAHLIQDGIMALIAAFALISE